LVVTLLIGAGVVYLLVSMRKSPIIISSRFEGKRRLDVFTPIYLILVLCAFVQTSFWVIDPDNNIHEPRSVFIIAVAAAFAYLRRQNQSQSAAP
ncbi:MAG: hypothetical protein JNJ78_26220, partial [Anaerolineae bacterium]|nr:hypothetical protein [Anaerolineae bacterium]